MSKHTPGPFELEECGCCGSYHRPGYEGDCRNDAERFPTPDALENLWRAAPDMLKELEFAVSLADDRAVWDYFDGGRRPSNAEADFIVRALPIIAKAKGEA